MEIKIKVAGKYCYAGNLKSNCPFIVFPKYGKKWQLKCHAFGENLQEETHNGRILRCAKCIAED